MNPQQLTDTISKGLLTVVITMTWGLHAWAGPPFVTDDPEPVEFRHWEVYISSITDRNPSGSSGTLPHVEVNYGPAPNLQVHMILPCASNRPAGQSATFGLGNTELGVKYRFVQETRRQPMVGTFPLVEVPSGSAAHGLGSGHFQFLLPIWVQKSWGPWTSYGGGGYFINPGMGNRSFWLYGWEVQKTLNEHLTLGGEVFGTTPDSNGAPNTLNFNIGGIYSPDEGHHILFSAGRGIRGDIEFMSYLGFQWTFGPHSGDQAEADSEGDNGDQADPNKGVIRQATH